MIAIIDYNAGNLASVANALDKLNVKYFIAKKQTDLKKADKIIFPGVGHANTAMKNLEKLNLVNVLKNWDKPFLGICLGMQLMCEQSEEGNTKCLEIIKTKVKKFTDKTLKIPHMGWNDVDFEKGNLLFKGIKNNSYFYFVHSYFVPINKNTIGKTKYNKNFSAAINYKNFYGLQFHPEKSGKVGLKILKNFVKL